MQEKGEKTRDLWKNGPSKEFGRLADGFPGKVTKGMNTIRFVARNNIPVVHTVTYSQVIFYERPHKEDSIPLRLIVGGNKIRYRVKVMTKTADLTTFK